MRKYFSIDPDGCVSIEDTWGGFTISPSDINRALKILKTNNNDAFKKAIRGIDIKSEEV